MPRAALPSRILAIADYETLGEGLAHRVEEAAQGGVAWVLLRARGLDTEGRARLASELLRRCPGLFLSMRGDPEAALRAGCRGVHFPSAQLDRIGTACEGRFRGAFSCVGASCHNRDEVFRAERNGADYAVLSPLYPPTSKPLHGTALGPEGFAEIAKGSRLKLFALGGMRPELLPEVVRAGAAGVAVLGDLFLDRDVRRRAEAWTEAVSAAALLAEKMKGF